MNEAIHLRPQAPVLALSQHLEYEKPPGLTRLYHSLKDVPSRWDILHITLTYLTWRRKKSPESTPYCIMVSDRFHDTVRSSYEEPSFRVKIQLPSPTSCIRPPVAL